MTAIRTNFQITILLLIFGMVSSLFAFILPIQGDEAASFLMDWSYPFSSLFFNYSDITNHKLFTILSRISMGVFGDYEWVFRLPVFLAGAFSIPFIYLLTQLIFPNRQVGCIAAFLLLFSFPRFVYSMAGRGYIFSIFLTIVLLIALIKILEQKSNLLWMILWGLGGVSFIFAIPSNLGLLCGLGAYFLIAAKYKKTLNLKFLIEVWGVWTLFIILSFYFGIIYDDLQRGVISYTKYANLYLNLKDLNITVSRFLETMSYLSQPWGNFLYLFSALGLISLRKNTQLLFLFSCIFIFPILFVLLSKIMGPPRTFVFWIPPIMILASLGIYEIAQKISINGRIVFVCSVLLVFGGVSINESKHYIDQKLDSSLTRLAESKEALEYLLSNTSPYDLILFPYSDRVLRHYVESISTKKMLNILKKGKLNRILTVSNKNIKPNQIFSVAGVNKKTWWAFPWTEKNFDIEKEINSLRIHSLNLKIEDLKFTNVEPSNNETFTLKTNSLFTVENAEKYKAMEGKILVLKRKVEKAIIAMSNEEKNINIKTKNSFLLHIYGRKYKQNSRSILSRTQGAVPFWLKGANSIARYFYLAPFFGIFNIQNGKLEPQKLHPHKIYLHPSDEINHFWKIQFRLSPIKEGNYKVRNLIELHDNKAYFIGRKTFLIHD